MYLRPFEAVVTEAKARSVMAAYNYVNGEHACSNQALLRDVLKEEWGFDGLVLSDWNAMKETVAPAQAGLDVEMPGPGRYWGAGQLAASVEVGEVDLDQLDDKVAPSSRSSRGAGAFLERATLSPSSPRRSRPTGPWSAGRRRTPWSFSATTVCCR